MAQTATFSPTNTPTSTPSLTPTFTPSASSTPTVTSTPTITPTSTPTCDTLTRIYYLTDGQTNPLPTATVYYDLSSTAGVTSRGLIGDPAPPGITSILYPGGSSSPSVADFVFQPGKAVTAFITNPPGLVSAGYGWIYPNPFVFDIAGGSWIFSNRFEGSLGTVSGPLSIVEEVAVYSWGPTTGDTLLFSAVSPTNLYGILSSKPVTVSFTVTEPALPITGSYLKVEYYLHFAFTGTHYDPGTVYLGFNTSDDHIVFPGDSCSPVPPLPTSTPFPVPPPKTPSPCHPNLWPNPFNPKWAVRGTLKIDCLKPGQTVSFFTIAGELVNKLTASSAQVEWDGRNQMGVIVSSGIYYFVVQDGESFLGRGKIIVVNK